MFTKTSFTFVFALVGFGLISIVGCNGKINNKQAEKVKTIHSTDLLGAWESKSEINNQKVNAVQIFAEGFFSTAYYTIDNQVFVGTVGGRWELVKDSLIMSFEYNTFDTSLVNSTQIKTISLNEQSLNIEGYSADWTKIDDGMPGELQGAWLMAGRKRDGEISRREEGPRKTMKILSGTRFQWIAYHTETTRFSGSGGGTYTTIDGVYTENIEFFSRDSSRVGASLEFNYELVDGEWHHSGLSSKGNPIYEIWARRN